MQLVELINVLMDIYEKDPDAQFFVSPRKIGEPMNPKTIFEPGGIAICKLMPVEKDEKPITTLVLCFNPSSSLGAKIHNVILPNVQDN